VARHLPRSYDRQAVRDYWVQRPISVARRLGHVVYELVPLAGSYFRDFLIFPSEGEQALKLQTLHASQLREALTNLGPAWVKGERFFMGCSRANQSWSSFLIHSDFSLITGGQQLSIRPDLIPPAVLKELQKLCDSVRPIPDEMALQVIREELKEPDLNRIFEDMHLVAAASIGQVYKAKLRATGENVAIKVQRPGMRKSFSLDLFLLQKYGDVLDTFTSMFTKQAPFHKALFDNFSKGSYSELDYENEADNQIYFQKELKVRKCKVLIPNVYQQYSTVQVLTSQWIEGTKLADSPKETIRELIPVGVELFLIQLLDIGAFHAGKRLDEEVVEGMAIV
jgi:predicted unusual protein kinase regulating ubiquinone biosynthesis (AarF/ABC1/UbiB family)